jgi:ADP-heptose:LPS heptosyltransferase
MTLRRNILIFHQAALGDFIVTWPLALAISRVFPQSRVIYVTHSQKGALAEKVLRVESGDGEAGWHRLLSPEGSIEDLPERSAKLLNGAHLVISFTAGQTDRFGEAVLKAAPHLKVISLDTRKESSGHVTTSLSEQLSSWPALASGTEQMIRSVQNRGAGIALTAKDRIVIHPGAGKEANRWPVERFLDLARKLKDSNKQIVTILGETEIEKWPADVMAQFEQFGEVHRPATLLELLHEIASASLFIGNDSGPGHLAGFIGVRTISLFGPSDPLRWKPLGPRVQVIHSDPISSIDPQNVYNEAARLMGG